MERETELEKAYDRALQLTELQGTAIARGDWEEMAELLEERERLLERAATLLKGPSPSNRETLAQRLKRLQELDTQNQKAIEGKQQELMRELRHLDRFKGGLTGYQAALGAADDPRFFDHDQ